MFVRIVARRPHRGPLHVRAWIAVTTLVFWVAAAGAAQAPAGGEPSISAFVRIKSPRNGQIGPHGQFYYVYNPDGINQLYRAPSGTLTVEPVKLTSFADGINGYALSDDGRYIVITAATGGSEQDRLYLLDTQGDAITTLYEKIDVVYTDPVWRRDSKAFAFRANDESSADFHIYVHDLESKSSRKVLAGTGHNYPVDFSGDGKRLMVGKYNSASWSQLFEVDLATGNSREVTPKDEQWSFDPAGYGAADEVFYVSTDFRGDLKRMHVIDVKTGAMSPILEELSKHEVDGATMNQDRSVLAVRANEDGYSALHLYKTPTLEPIALPQIPKGIVGSVDFSGGAMLYSVSNADTPELMYRWDLGQAGAKPYAVTKADTQGIDTTKFRLPELVHYPSFDGTKIPAFIYVPHGYKKGDAIPFIVHYHGGPESQFRPGFARTFQYFIARGFGIIAPNVRGSSGYGKAYLEADNYKNRAKSVRDGVWAAKYLVDAGYTKPGMIGAWGGSYGGFMVMAAITEAPEMFGAACNVVGICNFQTFLEQTKDYRRALREAEYGPLSDPEFLKSISPIYHIEKIQTPLMLAHGLNDPRVPFGEALQIAIGLIKRGQPVEQLYFPDEGHGFAKEENQLVYYKQLADFFEEYLKPKNEEPKKPAPKS